MIKRKTRLLVLSGIAATAAVGVTAAIAVPASQATTFDVDYFEAGAALPSLNHVVRAGTALSPVYGFFMEGILSTSQPQATADLDQYYMNKGYDNYIPYTIAGKTVSGGLKPNTKSKKYVFNDIAFNDNKNFNKKTGDSLVPAVSQSSEDLKNLDGTLYSPGVTDIVEVNEKDGMPLSFRARVNPDAGWSNGDKILASDFAATVKYMLDTSTASLGSQVLYETLHLRGAKDIISKQTDDGMTFDEAWQWAKDNNELPVEIDGTDNRWVHYYVETGTKFSTIVPYLGGAQFMPVNESFVESVGGIKKYGQTKDTILSDGPYKISSMDLDYMVTFEKNPEYYAPELVLMDHPGYKVAPSQAIELQLFKDGKLSNMDIPPELLASIYKQPSLIPLLGHGGTTPMTQGVLFSKSYSDKNGGPTANKDFRKAIMYGIDRNRYADYTNNSGSSPANSIFAPREKTAVSDEQGTNYYADLMKADYQEYDPKTKAALPEDLKFDGYDSATKYDAAFAAQHNHDYKDYLYNKQLANNYIDKYLTDSGKSSTSFKIDIVASEENKFLAIQNLVEETFGNKVKVESHLVSSQVMTDESLNGNYQALFNVLTTSIDDPWTLYSKFLVEDGYKDSDNHVAYTQSIDKDGNDVPSMEVTSRYWGVPGFTLEDAIDSIDSNVDGETKAEYLQRLHITADQWDTLKKASAETQIKKEPASWGKAPQYKYGVATQMSTLTEETIQSFTLDDKTDPEYDASTNNIVPFVREDGSTSSTKLFKKQSDLFNFYTEVEKVMRDSSWFVPTLTSTSGWFIERRGLRGSGNQEGLPYGYRNIYPIDNFKLIDSIEERVKKEYGVSLVLDRM